MSESNFTGTSKATQYPGGEFGGPPAFSGGPTSEGEALPSLNAVFPETVGETTFTPAPPSKFKKIITHAAWASFALLSLCFFTVTKLPEDRIKGLIQGNIASVLASKGMSMTAEKTVVSLFPKPLYIMSDVTLNLPPPQPPAHIDKIEVYPSLSTLLSGKLGAVLEVENADGTMNILGAARGSKLDVQYDIDKLDIGKLGLLNALADIKGSAIVSGKGALSINTDAFNQTDGQVALTFNKIVIDSQSISGFTIPKISISKGRIDMDINQGRGVLKSLSLGQSGNATDDLKANFSGDLNFAKNISASTVNVRGNFSLSPAILKNLSLLEVILGPAKQPDGSYGYKITGPFNSLSPTPLGANGN